MAKIQEPSRVSIWEMFNQYATTYDRSNLVMTFGLIQRWRKKMVSFLPDKERINLLDCATGTADQLICFLEGSNKIHRAIGIDLAEEMIAVGKKKVQGKPYAHALSFQIANVLELPFADKTFDCVTTSFGIRNFTDVKKSVSEFYRALKPSGRVLILEATVPEKPWLKSIHLFYLRHILPHIGWMISKKIAPFRCLNAGIETFHSREHTCSLLSEAGFSNVQAHLLTGGIATIYSGDKP